MKCKEIIFLSFILMSSILYSQYSFSGYVDKERWQSDVFLSYIDDYRKINGVYTEQIISRTTVDSLGFFEFTGNQLDNSNRLYRIHVDNCNTDETGLHFNGHCEDSKEIIFIARNSDTISFPSTFDEQMFCEITSTNEFSDAIIRIDSIKDLMKFSYTDYDSEANIQLNHSKWFKTLKNFGGQLNEPLADLYIYEFLSNRSSITHQYYLNTLESDSYFSELLDNLEEKYPESSYTAQYQDEFMADSYVESKSSKSQGFPKYILLGLALLLILNAFLVIKYLFRGKRSKKHLLKKLTNQEAKILDLILQNKTNKEIADLNFISLSTVKSHISNIYKKLEVSSREEIKSLY